MLVVAIATAKNEADIIEAFVRHTLAVAQRLVIVDNGSVDGTREILEALRHEGLAVEIVDDPSTGQRQAERMTMLMRDHAVGRHAADWVLALDADEFVIAGDRLFEAGDAEKTIGLPWRSFVPDDGELSAELNPVVRITRRLKEENWRWTKALIPGKLAARPGARLTQGSHQLLIGEQPCEETPAPSAFLAHFPIRSPGQYLAKVAISHLQHQSMPDRRADWGWLYRDAFKQLKIDPAGLAANFRTAACRYAAPAQAPIQSDETVLDPLPYLGGPLRYTSSGNDAMRPLRLLAAFAESIVQQFAALTAALSEEERMSVPKLAESLVLLHRQLSEQAQQLQHQGVAGTLQHEHFLRANQLAEIRNTELTELRQQLAASERTRRDQSNLLEDREAHLQRTLDQLRRLDLQMRQMVIQEGQREQEHQEACASIRQSWTWRAGRLFIGPASLLKQAYGRANTVARRRRERKAMNTSTSMSDRSE